MDVPMNKPAQNYTLRIRSSHPVSIKQMDNDCFVVTYGKQVSAPLNYQQAAKELGEALMHAMCCASIIE